MLQEILALTTVVAAAGYTGYSFYKSICSSPSRKKSGCCGCPSSGSCQLKELAKRKG